MRKIIFTQTKSDENNFTSCVWWALIEEIAPRAEVKRRWLVVLEATMDMWVAAIGEVLVCSREPNNAEKFSL